jgi:hypothetical protein
VIDGKLLVDAHVHVARLPTLSPDWQEWVRTFGDGVPIDELFDGEGTPRPQSAVVSSARPRSERHHPAERAASRRRGAH